MIPLLILILLIYFSIQVFKFFARNALPKELFEHHGGEYDSNTGLDNIMTSGKH